MQRNSHLEWSSILSVLLLLLILPSLGFAQLSLLKGTVKSEDGKPLTGVYVFFGLANGAETDKEGSFKISKSPVDKVITFRLAGYKPLTKILEPTTEKLDVVLEEGSRSSWIVPPCSTKEDLQRRTEMHAGLGSIWLLLPDGAMVKKANDIDYVKTSIGYGSEERREWLSILDGPLATSGRPPSRFFLSSREFTARLVKTEKIELADYMGKTKDGKRWRWIGGASSASYTNASDEAADYFDKIIDSACWAEPKQK